MYNWCIFLHIYFYPLFNSTFLRELPLSSDKFTLFALMSSGIFMNDLAKFGCFKNILEEIWVKRIIGAQKERVFDVSRGETFIEFKNFLIESWQIGTQLVFSFKEAWPHKDFGTRKCSSTSWRTALHLPVRIVCYLQV